MISLMTGTLVSEVQQELKARTQIDSSFTSPSGHSYSTATTDLPLEEVSSPESLTFRHHKGNDSLDDDMNIRIATAVSFLIGIYQLIFGIMQMGFVSVYLSEQLVSGFTTAASLYVFTSQLPFMLGCNLPHHSGTFALIYSYADIFGHVSEINATTVAISITCCLVLVIFKIYINEVIRKKTGLNIPFPIELILVIIGTISSIVFDLSNSRSVDVVGKIPSGLPDPILPDWSLVCHSVNSSSALCY